MFSLSRFEFARKLGFTLMREIIPVIEVLWVISGCCGVDLYLPLVELAFDKPPVGAWSASL